MKLLGSNGLAMHYGSHFITDSLIREQPIILLAMYLIDVLSPPATGLCDHPMAVHSGPSVSNATITRKNNHDTKAKKGFYQQKQFDIDIDNKIHV
jgi:hypothetical protein